MIIKNIIIREVFDSRMHPTLEVGVAGDAGFTAFSQIPMGKSTGSREAVCLKYGDARRALEETILPAVKGQDLASVRALDEKLLALDGTPNKAKLGGNVMLGISLSFARAMAHESGKAMWELLREEFFAETAKEEEKPPKIFANFVNGGMHGENNLNFQEYLVIMDTAQGVRTAVEQLISFQKALKSTLRNAYGWQAVGIGDEAGFSLDFDKNDKPIEVLEGVIREYKLEQVCSVGIDAAATSFFADDMYFVNGRRYTPDEMLLYYEELFSRYTLLCSIEDPFAEDDFERFGRLAVKAGERFIVGDDLTVTNPAFIEHAHAGKAVNAVIIKPNQVGTLTETAAAVNLCIKYGYRTVFSHRSGETEDAFIIQIAKAAQGDAVKIGPPARERLLKYNELLRLYS